MPLRLGFGMFLPDGKSIAAVDTSKSFGTSHSRTLANAQDHELN